MSNLCAFELEESTLSYVIDKIGADKLLYSSVHLHWDTLALTVKKFRSRRYVSEVDKRQIAWINPQLYDFKS
jgi:hypothetical protein